jgi:GTPase
VDGSDADPRAQIAAVREVLGEIGAAKVPELMVVNKADAADPLEIKGLCLAERGAVVVSARTGLGLADLLAAVEAALPGRDTEVTALVPFGRGDLVARAHREGEVVAVAHCEGGTQLTARVPPDLAAQLAGASAGAGLGAKAPAGDVAEPS